MQLINNKNFSSFNEFISYQQDSPLNTTKKESDIYFEYTNFQKFRNDQISIITEKQIHSKFNEIRDLMVSLKPIENNNDWESFEKCLDKISSTKKKSPIIKNESIEEIKNSQLNNNITEESGYKSQSFAFEKSIEEKDNENKLLLKTIQNMQDFMSENLKETKLLKEILIENTKKTDNNEIYDSFAKDYQVNFGGKGMHSSNEKKKKMEISNKNNKEEDTSNLKIEISEAERRVFEMQNQRLTTKLQNLNAKIDDLNKKNLDLKNYNQILNNYVDKLCVIGKISLYENINIDQLKELNKNDVDDLNFENYWFFIEKNEINFYQSLIPLKIYKTIKFSEIFKLTNIFENIYVLKKNEKDEEITYDLLKNKFSSDFFETLLLGINFKIHSMKNQNKNLLELKELNKLFEKINRTEIPSEAPGRKKHVISTSFSPETVKSHDRSSIINSDSKQTNFKPKSLEKKEINKNSPKIINKFNTANEIINSPFNASLKIKKEVDELYVGFLKAAKILKNGFVFLKYGKFGDPHERIIYLSSCETKLEYRPLNKKIGEFIELSQIKNIKNGRDSINFQRFKTKNIDQIELSFSVICLNRNLDLEANNQENKQRFINSLKMLIKRNNLETNNKEQQLPLRKLITQEYSRNKIQFKDA